MGIGIPTGSSVSSAATRPVSPADASTKNSKSPGPCPLLPGHLHHFTYENAADRAARSAHYASLWAQSAHEAGQRVAPWTGPLHAAARWGKGYLLKAGFLDGAVGWDIALGNAREVALKYSLLAKLNGASKSSRS